MESLEEAVKSYQRAMNCFIDKQHKLIEVNPDGKATSVETFIQKKKQNEPFYKSSRKKPWE